MKTEISKFCETYLHTIHALPLALKTAAERIEQSTDTLLFDKPLSALNDIRARVRSLVDKLECQQAYLLIFGPLKSGKSTLMNAISGTYVSEVTSLPGYPCLVYVQHSNDPEFSVTRYNGRESAFVSASVLKDVIADSHIALADQIRATEQRGEDFDPRTHFTEAIRRVDVKFPVESLAESSTVLVDTPGLYSRMNFGYDVLTREFRDSAACAVFVVKTDNLFLEQVFQEFNQLLGLFSRIFLLINVDSSKRDLQPDGSLCPSAESQDPEQIIDAFKTLSMAGPLRKAYEQKRVRIHAIDLLNAGSAILSRNGNGANSLDQKQEQAFGDFVRDLAEYLNSSDYTVEFIRDSLRQGNTLCDEVRQIADGNEIAQLRRSQEKFEGQMTDLDGQIAAVDRLLKVDWDATFEKVRADVAANSASAGRATAGELRKELREALDRWYATNDSLKALTEKHWNSLIADAALALAEDARFGLQSLLATPLGGSEPPALVVNDLHAVGFSLGPIGQAALPALSEDEAVDRYALTFKEEELPVRKSFTDWVLFRKMATVRRRIFGESLAQEIEPEVKRTRLRENSREVLHNIIDETINEKFPALPTSFADKLIAGYVAQFRTLTLEALRQQREDLVLNRAEVQAPFEVNIQILASMQALAREVAKISDEIAVMTQQENALSLAADVDESTPRLESEVSGVQFLETSAA